MKSRRARLLQALSVGGLRLHGIESDGMDGGDGDDGGTVGGGGWDRVEVVARLTADDRRSDSVLEQVVGRISLEPGVVAARWRVAASAGED